ncbi:MAG: MBL fold metallo-hydrolase [Bacilli bacterium]
MKIKSIRSGSKGNSTLIYTPNTKILIDVGIAYLTIKSVLEKENINIKELDAILITHNHSDHIKGLATLIKKTNLKIYIPKDMILDLKDYVPLEKMQIIDEEFDINDLHIKLIHTSHDVSCSVGYIITNGISSIFYATDTGYINRKYLKQMKNQDLYFIESNHDEEMLMNGPYPYYLKQRVISDEGHLSNKTTAKYLSSSVGDNTKYIILAHLSEKNNTEELAMRAIKEEFSKKQIKGKKIFIAKQNEELPTIEV